MSCHFFIYQPKCTFPQLMFYFQIGYRKGNERIGQFRINQKQGMSPGSRTRSLPACLPETLEWTSLLGLVVPTYLKLMVRSLQKDMTIIVDGYREQQIICHYWKRNG